MPLENDKLDREFVNDHCQKITCGWRWKDTWLYAWIKAACTVPTIVLPTPTSFPNPSLENGLSRSDRFAEVTTSFPVLSQD